MVFYDKEMASATCTLHKDESLNFCFLAEIKELEINSLRVVNPFTKKNE